MGKVHRWYLLAQHQCPTMRADHQLHRQRASRQPIVTRLGKQVQDRHLESLPTEFPRTLQRIRTSKLSTLKMSPTILTPPSVWTADSLHYHHCPSSRETCLPIVMTE